MRERDGSVSAALTTLTIEPGSETPSAGHLAPGTNVGRYEIVSVLGEGGMGVVYRAFDPHLSRDVALKLIAKSPTSDGADLGQARLMREAQALAMLSHPNVVAAFDIGSHDDGGVFIAMELIEGVPLGTWLEAPRTQREIVRALVAAGRGLAAAHAVGLLHRDFKPSNVMVSRDGRVRVVDFGLARAVDQVDAMPETDDESSPAAGRSGDLAGMLSIAISATGSIMGTPGYMAPEQVIRDPVDERSDQFAFAATAFHALTGRGLYTGKRIADYRAALVANQRTPWSPKVARRVRRVIDRGLAIRAGERYATFAELVDALERTLRPRRFVIVANALAIAGIVAAVAVTRSSSPSSCIAESAGFETAWGPSRRALLADAFVQTKDPGQADAFVRVAARLDDVRDRWLAATQATCEDTRVRGHQSERVLALRTTCLQRKRGDVTTFVDALLRHATPAMIDRAATSVLEVGDLDDCTDTALLVDSADGLPDDAVQRGKVIGLTHLIDSAHALVIAGEYEVALARLRGLVASADATGHQVTIARARLELGEVLGKVSLRDESATNLAIALRVAGAAESRPLVARAALQLLHTAVLEDRFVAAAQVLPFVESAIDLSRPSRLAIGLLLDKVAIAANDRAYPEALRLLAHAAAHADALDLTIATERLHIIAEWGITLDAMEDFQGAEEKYRETVVLARKLYGDHHRSILLAYSNVAATQISGGNLAGAEATLREVSPLLAGFPPRSREAIGLIAVEGTLWQARGDSERAIAFYQAALDRYSAAFGDTSSFATKMHIRIGKSLLALSRPADAVPHFELWLTRKVAEHAASDYQAEAGFLLARALWDAGQRRRAAVTAETARVQYELAGADFADDTKQVAAWLAARTHTAAPRTGSFPK